MTTYLLTIAAAYALAWWLLPIQRYKPLAGRNGRNTLFRAEGVFAWLAANDLPGHQWLGGNAL